MISIQLVAVFKENGTRYVYLKTPDGFKKQEIKTGFENEEFVLVEVGLKEGDKVFLELPAEKVELAEK